MEQENDLSKTMGYDTLRRDGVKVLHKTLLAADREMIDGEIQRDLDQLVNGMAKGIRLGKGTFAETMDLVRLVGYLQELSLVVGMMPAFGFMFKEEYGKLSVSFDPKYLDKTTGEGHGLEKQKQKPLDMLELAEALKNLAAPDLPKTGGQ